MPCPDLKIANHYKTRTARANGLGPADDRCGLQFQHQRHERGLTHHRQDIGNDERQADAALQSLGPQLPQIRSQCWIDAAASDSDNCAVRRFDLHEGILTQGALLVDTTRMRARGTARVNFHGGSLAVRLQAEAKKPQFFSLATPVEVNGTLDDFKVSLPKGSIVATVKRFLTSIVTTPFKMLTSQPPPANGSDVCAGAMRHMD